jgi:eukaryotic-like serine/threonine-protein kinase
MIDAGMPMRPAEKLVGMSLPNGWTVVSRVSKKPGATGGFFSISYKVSNKDGRVAFLKAIDVTRAFQTSDPMRELQKITESFNFERDLLEKCKKLDRVITALEDGTVTIDGLPVPYLIFELAKSDMRGDMDLLGAINLARALRMLHHITVGLQQLHGVGVAHQDLKPSNVLVFENLIFKLADLGQSAHPDYQPPHHDFLFAGDWTYAPPELRYNYTHPDFKQRRFGCDAFLLGNIVLFTFTKLTMSALLFSYVNAIHMPRVWGRTYEEVLPFLQTAFNEALAEAEQELPEEVQSDIILILQQLCEPDLSKRGHPLDRFKDGNTFRLDRYMSIFDRLAVKAEGNLFRKR